MSTVAKQGCIAADKNVGVRYAISIISLKVKGWW